MIALPNENLEDRFLSTVLEARALSRIEDPEAIQRLEELSAVASEFFVGKTVSVNCASTVTVEPYRHGPITSYYSGFKSTDDWVACDRQVMQRPGMMLLYPHPYSAKGKVQSLNLGKSTIQIEPRPWSPYRRHDGFFVVQLLNGQDRLNVEVEF